MRSIPPYLCPDVGLLYPTTDVASHNRAFMETLVQLCLPSTAPARSVSKGDTCLSWLAVRSPLQCFSERMRPDAFLSHSLKRSGGEL